MEKIFTIFIFAFLLISAIGLIASLFLSGNQSQAENCRKSASFAVIIALVLMYLRFVFAGI